MQHAHTYTHTVLGGHKIVPQAGFCPKGSLDFIRFGLLYFVGVPYVSCRWGEVKPPQGRVRSRIQANNRRRLEAG